MRLKGCRCQVRRGNTITSREMGWWDRAGIGQTAGRSVGVVGQCRDRSNSREISRGGGTVQG